MKNVRVTNMDNGVSLVISKEQFDISRTSLSENTVYEFTDSPLTSVTIPRQYGKRSVVEYVAKLLGGMPNEVNRTAII